MEASEREAIARRLIEEAFNAGDLAVVDELMHPAMAEHQDFGPGHPDGPEGARRVVASLRAAFSDFHLAIDDLAVAGEVVWLRMTGSGTNDGPFMRHPPTGRAMRCTVFDALRIVDGRIVEHWGVPDRLAVLFQLGLAAPPSARPAA